MTAIYIHIPFCAQKCPYCSFYSFFVKEEFKEKMIADYTKALYQEIENISKQIKDKKVKTLYFGGGTPSILGANKLIEIVNYIQKYFDLEDIAELGIELNPYPTQDIYNLIQTFSKALQKLPRLRFSFGIQTLDNQILQDTTRETNFNALVDFLRGLRDLKRDNIVFNFDFIAFGKFNKTRKGNKQLRDPNKLEFFKNFVNSQFADSFSLYTLELFPGSKWKVVENENYFGSDDEIFEEFEILKDIILDAGYHRYEFSNFCRPGMSSIHNRTYRNMEDYICFGTSASSFCKIENIKSEFLNELGIQKNKEPIAIRRTNIANLKEYQEGEKIDKKQIAIMNRKDWLIESFFLKLRTDEGIENIEQYKDVLVDNYMEIIHEYRKQNLILLDDKLVLSDQGMNVSNTIITELLKEL